MAHTRNIRDTLLKALFLNPNPSRRSAYDDARRYLYPNESDFVEFLRTDSEQEMVLLAKGILLDLVFVSYCPPPSHLLINLFNSQKTDIETIKDGDFVPRDHFVHLVHLYLLGIYLFAYHDSLHRRCTADLNRQRRQSLDWSVQLSDVSGYRLFVTMWRQFVLYHDLGYPVERIAPVNRTSALGTASLKPFSRISKSIHKDLSFKAIARIIAAKTLLTQEHHATFEEMFIQHHSCITIDPYSKDITLRREGHEYEPANLKLVQRWRKAIYLPNVSGTHDLHTIFSVVPDLEICALLEDAAGLAEVALFGPPTQALYFHGPKQHMEPALRRYISDITPQLAWRDSHCPVGYRWLYFAVAPAARFQKELKTLVGDQLPNFQILLDKVESFKAYRTLRTKGFDSGTRLSALAYAVIIGSRGYMPPPDDDEGPFEELDEMFLSLANSRNAVIAEIPTLVGQICRDIAAEYITNTSNQLMDIIETKGSGAAAKIVADNVWLAKAKGEAQRALGEQIQTSISEPLAGSIAAKACTNAFRAELDNVVQSRREVEMDPFSGKTIDASFELSAVLKRREELERSVNELFQRDGFPAFGEMVAKYLPYWVRRGHTDFPIKSRFCDHGFVSAIVALTSSWEYEACLKTLMDGAAGSSRHVSLALGVTSPEDRAWFQLEVRWLRAGTAETIALHNVYPDDLVASFGKGPGRSGANYRTQISRQPCMFLALLSDGLQKWDRVCLLNEVTSQVSGVVPGSRYNLEIRQDQLLHIWYLGSGLDMKSAEIALRSSLASYLEDADSIIKLSLEET